MKMNQLKQKFNADQRADLEMKEFFASDESEEEDDMAEDPSERKNKSLEKYRALFTSGDGLEEEDEHQDMEVTFHTGLEGVSKKALEKKNYLETVCESYLKRKKEKRLKIRSKNSSEDESDYSDQASEEVDDFFKEEPPSKKTKKAAVNEKKTSEVESKAADSAAELELLLGDDEEGKNTMKAYKINRKKIKGKKCKKEPVSEDKEVNKLVQIWLRSAACARDLAQQSQNAQDNLVMEDAVSATILDPHRVISKSMMQTDFQGLTNQVLLVNSVRRKS